MFSACFWLECARNAHFGLHPAVLHPRVLPGALGCAQCLFHCWGMDLKLWISWGLDFLPGLIFLTYSGRREEERALPFYVERK